MLYVVYINVTGNHVQNYEHNDNLLKSTLKKILVFSHLNKYFCTIKMLTRHTIALNLAYRINHLKSYVDSFHIKIFSELYVHGAYTT